MVIPILAAWEMFVAFDKLGIKILKSASAKDAKTVEE
jgi:hypothetical protein